MSCFPQSETVETTLLHVVATLRHIRNGERPANKLPPEILSRIFSLVPGPSHQCGKGDSLMRDFGPHAIAPLADLLPLLSVCSVWRSVATSCSLLWVTLDNRDSRAVAISSRYRPASGLLDAHIGESSHLQHLPHPDRLRRFHELNAAFVELLRSEGHRIREFHVQVPAALLQDLVDFPGESLRTCHLGLLDSRTDDLRAICPLFRGCTPKLKSLVMKSFLVIPLNDFPSLTHLILDGTRLSTADSSYVFLNFFLFLSRCPNLEILHLIALDTARLKDLPDGVVIAPLQLQRLRKFSNEEALCDHSGSYHLPYIGPYFRLAILPHLHFPSDCLIRLATILPHELRVTFNSLPFDTPFTSVYLGAAQIDQPLDFYTGEPNGIESQCLSLMATAPPHQCGVRVDFQMPGTRYRSRNVTTQSARASLRDGIRGASLLASVRELWVVPMATVLLGEPCSLISSLPHLSTLVLGLYPLALDTPENVRVHWEPLRALEVRDDCVIPCPHLHTLCVYVTAEEHVVQLYDVLLSRGEAGYPVRRLVVGFYWPLPSSVLELAEGLWGLVEDFTLLECAEPCPDDLLWVHRLPLGCRDISERNVHWPAWM